MIEHSNDANPFKEGDLVEVVDADGPHFPLQLGGHHIVDGPYRHRHVYLKDGGGPWSVGRFKKVDEKSVPDAAQVFAEVGMLAVDVPAQMELPLEELTKVEQAVMANMQPAKDMVNMPAHYARFKIEPIRFIQENNLTPLQGKVIKYLLRWDAKDGKQDLRKARRCLEMFIKWVDGDPDWWKREEAKS